MNIIKGYNPPTTSTPGNIGDYYIDISTNLMYECTAVNSAERYLGFITIEDYTLASAVYVWELCRLINNQNKTILANGEYTADTGYTGIGVITVNNTRLDSAFGTAYDRTITNTAIELKPTSGTTGRYMQIEISNVDASNPDKYDYWFVSNSNSPLTVIVDSERDGKFDIDYLAVKYTESSERETNVHVSLTITVSNGVVIAKSNSSSYYFTVSYRIITPTAAIF